MNSQHAVASLLLLTAVIAIGAVAGGSAWLGPDPAGDGGDGPSAAVDAGPSSTGDGCPTERRYVGVYDPRSPPDWFPESNLDMSNLQHQTYEVTRYPMCEPTAQQLDAAWELYNGTFEGVEERGFFDVQEAYDDGYRKAYNHYLNMEYLLDNETLDPTKPEFLVYYHVADGDSGENDTILAGVMYEIHKRPGRQVGGPLTVWHYHPAGCCHSGPYLRALRRDTPYRSFDQAYEEYLGGEGPTLKDRTAEMMHVWFVRHPDGPFSSSMAATIRDSDEVEKMNESAFKDYIMDVHDRRDDGPT